MGWFVLAALIVFLALTAIVLLLRRTELQRTAARLADLREAKKTGSHRARLQYPLIDLGRCIGCGTCIDACPEDGVLGLIHGQAAVIHGARCVSHGACAKACPVGAIELTLGDLSDRRDIPVVSEQFEVPASPGLFLAGEVTGYALIRTAIAHGAAIADEVTRRIRPAPTSRKAAAGELLDLCIVGAGPAGIAASLQAKANGLNFVTLEQEVLGGTVAKYPRRKLVMTQPVTLPLHGRLKRSSYSKEELMELWSELATRYELPIHAGEELAGVDRKQDGSFVIRTKTAEFRARFVCLALGRRGTPRKLGVPGEDLPKVAYSLIDAQSYTDRRVLVVGGGDSAVEAALGLAEQPGNEVTLSYRKPAFFRLKARNEERLKRAIRSDGIHCLMESQVLEIRANSVRVGIQNGDDQPVVRDVANDDVFIMAGGIPPFELLGRCGVSFDPADRPAESVPEKQDRSLLNSLTVALGLAAVTFVWVAQLADYYRLPLVYRPLSAWHELLRPAGPVGLACGMLATALIVVNLTYLVRRNRMGSWLPGSLTGWMTSHVATGILALLLLLVHAAMAPKNTLGGHGLLAVGVLVVTGAIGRYFYAFMPRAANGRELELAELQSQTAANSSAWDRQGRGFGDDVLREVGTLVDGIRWKEGFFERLIALVKTQRGARRVYKRLRVRAKQEGLSRDQIDQLVLLARRAYKTSLMTSHYGDLRALLGSWRYFHRWIALLMVLLAIAHICVALRYGGVMP